MEQRDPAARLAARLNYRVRAGRTTPLDDAERAIAEAAIQLTGSAADELEALRQTLPSSIAIDTRVAAALYEIIHSAASRDEG